MAPKARDGEAIASISGAWISWAHTGAAYAAFLGALIVGLYLHYHKIVENEFYGYPQEWFPSVSATIGDRYPERSVFQVFIAITSGPRFALVGLWYLLTARKDSLLPKFVAATGIFRTLTCGGWTYVTSTDDHDWHDIFMISYLVATLPWTIGCFALTPGNPKALKYRKLFAGLFFGTLVPLIYFFIQHKVHKVAGAYTTYAFFEWSLVLLDVGFDAVTIFEFDDLEIVIRDVKGSSRGDKTTSAPVAAHSKNDNEVASSVYTKFSWTYTIDAIADVYCGFVFWSTLTSLGLLVWYFPLWYMGISGYEALVMTTVSPFLLAIGSIRRAVTRHSRIMHLLSLSGLLAWLVKRPDLRLFTVGFAVSMSCMSWTAMFFSDRNNQARLESRIMGFSMGLVLSSIAKYAFRTINPVWPVVHEGNGGWNRLGLGIAVLAVLISTRHATSSSQESAQQKLHISLLSGLGLGGLFFGMHYLLSDSSTMILWVWEGYPVRGPLAAPHGGYVFLAMTLGLLFGLFYPRIVRAWTCFGIASLATTFFTIRGNWLGFYSGLVLAAYLMAMSPVLIASAVRFSAASTFGFGFFAYNIMVLFSVWVVAYAFVPGGPLVRERTDWVMITTMLLIGCGVFACNSPTSSNAKSGRKPNKLGTRRQRLHFISIVVALQLLAGSISYLRFPSYNYKPYHPKSKLITAGIWTVHFGLDNPMWESSRRMRDLIKELELDVVGLLESDTQRIIMGNRDFTQYLAEDLDMYVDYGPGPNKNTWGAALLSKFPIVNSTHHLLPSPVGELAPAIAATLNAYGSLVDVLVFHSGQEEDPEDRRLQAQYLSKLMGRSSRPSILLSYLVVKPGEGNYNTYVSELSGMRDIDPSDWDRWCEYILYKGLRRTGYARVSRDTITDTELQVGKFIVGRNDTSNELVPEELQPPDQRFPALFKGQGVRGHRYHVFNEPRYYA